MIPDTLLPNNPLSDEIWGFISEWSQRRTWWNSTSNAVYLSGLGFFHVNLQVFDHLPLSHVTQTSQLDFQKLSTDTFTACGRLLNHSTTLSHIAEWKIKPKKGWYRHFSIHPGIKSSFWKWDDDSFCHDLVCFSANRDIMTGKTTGKLKIQGIYTKQECRTKYSTDYIIVYNWEPPACLRTVI